ncbi:DoxX family protein [Thalassobacillus devorans]|uniref:DoxX family protein n=1 Tax=Thalassobacillus devorans TaxID=279813 RepID=UPI00048A86FC|nr:DoxX family protein [Thalassobacillus devorans]
MNKHEAGASILRVILGVIFFVHGLDKFQAGIGNTVGFFDSIGVPGFLAYVVATIELVGGIALILGLGTKIAASLFAVIMLGAIFTVKLSAGFLGGYELDLALLAMSIYVALSDNTALSLEQAMFSTNQNSVKNAS